AHSVPAWTLAGAAAGAAFTMAVNVVVGGELEIAGRLIIAAFIGAVFGGTIGFLVGGGFFEPRRKASSNLAAEEGVVVGATEPVEVDAADQALAGHDPVRVDTLDAEGPEGTVTTEDRQGR
ncbi:MAG: hypothetical protein ACRDZ3_21605, partial [Acidimicrobiia bacterium]